MSLQAQKRLTKEYKNIQKAPPPFIIAKPSENNILVWHYVITGPPNTYYEGGQYMGTLTFHREYPFKPPSIQMNTPSGRFRVNTKLCLSMSDFHPDTWNPAWSVSTILTGLLSFMTSEDTTTGSISTTPDYRRKAAKESKRWNCSNSLFQATFPDLVEQNWIDIAKEEKKTKDINKSKESSLTDVENITDPEDRIRAKLLKEKSNVMAKNGSILNSGWLYVAVVGILLALGLSVGTR